VFRKKVGLLDQLTPCTQKRDKAASQGPEVLSSRDKINPTGIINNVESGNNLMVTNKQGRQHDLAASKGFGYPEPY